MQARALPMGDAAVLIEVADLSAVLALHASVREQMATADPGEERGSEPWGWVEDVVPAARTVLLLAAAGADLTQLRRSALDLAASISAPRDLSHAAHALHGRPGPHDRQGPDADVDGDAEVDVEIPVTYDGADLDDVAAATGMSRDAVVEAHTDSRWTVAFFGFAPGFAYLAGGDPRLEVGRRSEPRTAVPAGAVGLAGEFSAVYPRRSPGGWHIIGHTDRLMWDAERDPPSALQPGQQVRFVRQHEP
ncbi:MAG: allophanate hydrolase subunit 1 [Ornithinimicrobium sp.]